MAEKWLDRFRDEIIQLHRQRYTQARIRRYLEDKYTIDVPKTTLSNFIKELHAAGLLSGPDEPPLPPEADHFVEQFEVIKSLSDRIDVAIAGVAQVNARMGELEAAAAKRHQEFAEAFKRLSDLDASALQRHEALLAAINEKPASAPSQDQGLSLSVLRDILKQQSQDIAALRQRTGFAAPEGTSSSPWHRALLITGGFWAALLVLGAALYYAPWRMPLSHWIGFLPWR
jgi:hypothetical protein